MMQSLNLKLKEVNVSSIGNISGYLSLAHSLRLMEGNFASIRKLRPVLEEVMKSKKGFIVPETTRANISSLLSELEKKDYGEVCVDNQLNLSLLESLAFVKKMVFIILTPSLERRSFYKVERVICSLLSDSPVTVRPHILMLRRKEEQTGPVLMFNPVILEESSLNYLMSVVTDAHSNYRSYTAPQKTIEPFVFGGAFSSMSHKETMDNHSASASGCDAPENNGDGFVRDHNEESHGEDNENASSSDSSDDEASIDVKDAEDRVKALDIVALNQELKKFHTSIYLLMEKSVHAKLDLWEPIRGDSNRLMYEAWRGVGKSDYSELRTILSSYGAALEQDPLIQSKYPGRQPKAYVTAILNPSNSVFSGRQKFHRDSEEGASFIVNMLISLCPRYTVAFYDEANDQKKLISLDSGEAVFFCDEFHAGLEEIGSRLHVRIEYGRLDKTNYKMKRSTTFLMDDTANDRIHAMKYLELMFLNKEDEMKTLSVKSERCRDDFRVSCHNIGLTASYRNVKRLLQKDPSLISSRSIFLLLHDASASLFYLDMEHDLRSFVADGACALYGIEKNWASIDKRSRMSTASTIAAAILQKLQETGDAAWNATCQKLQGFVDKAIGPFPESIWLSCYEVSSILNLLMIPCSVWELNSNLGQRFSLVGPVLQSAKGKVGMFSLPDLERLPYDALTLVNGHFYFPVNNVFERSKILGIAYILLCDMLAETNWLSDEYNSDEDHICILEKETTKIAESQLPSGAPPQCSGSDDVGIVKSKNQPEVLSSESKLFENCLNSPEVESNPEGHDEEDIDKDNLVSSIFIDQSNFPKDLDAVSSYPSRVSTGIQNYSGMDTSKEPFDQLELVTVTQKTTSKF